MAGARSHKDLICWQRAYELELHVYELMNFPSICGSQTANYRKQSSRWTTVSIDGISPETN
jgi:hypothetical protein